MPILEIGSLEDFNERSYATAAVARAGGRVARCGRAAAATAGLYGVSSYVVAMRSREMAIRMAVGASVAKILMMILGQSMRVAMVGLLVGGAAAVAASRLDSVGVSRHPRDRWRGVRGCRGLFLAAMLLASADSRGSGIAGGPGSEPEGRLRPSTAPRRHAGHHRVPGTVRTPIPFSRIVHHPAPVSRQCHLAIDQFSGVLGLNASHDTSGFQFPNVPLGLSFHAQTCSV